MKKKIKCYVCLLLMFVLLLSLTQGTLAMPEFVVEEGWEGTFAAGENYGYRKLLENNTSSPINIFLITVLYSPDGKVVVIDTDNNEGNSLGVGDQAEYSTSITIPDVKLEEGYYLITYLWNGVNLTPLDETEKYPYNPEDVVVVVDNPEKGNSYSTFYVYVKGTKATSNMYTKYRFYYLYSDYVAGAGSSTSSNSSQYRIKNAYKAERTGKYTFVDSTCLLHEGEVEMAIKEANSDYYTFGSGGSPDFIGGFHGDENLYDVCLKIDGKEVPLNQAGNYTGKKVQFCQKSYLDRCNVKDSKLIDHIKDYSITKDGIDLNQTVTWRGPARVAYAYLCMFPMMRYTSGGERVTDYASVYWSDNTCEATYDLSDYGYQNLISTGEKFSAFSTEQIKPKEDKTYVNKAHLWSKSGDIDAYVWTDRNKVGEKDFTKVEIRRSGDNKVYFGSNYYEYVAEGDVWEIKNHYDIKINN